MSPFVSTTTTYALVALSTFGAAHLIALAAARLTTFSRRKASRAHLRAVPPPLQAQAPTYAPVRSNAGPLDATFAELQNKAGINIHALLAKKVDLTPTPESIALHKAFVKRESRLRARRLRREQLAATCTSVRTAFLRLLTFSFNRNRVTK
jgi:hypothetical protein